MPHREQTILLPPRGGHDFRVWTPLRTSEPRRPDHLRDLLGYPLGFIELKHRPAAKRYRLAFVADDDEGMDMAHDELKKHWQ